MYYEDLANRYKTTRELLKVIDNKCKVVVEGGEHLKLQVNNDLKMLYYTMFGIFDENEVTTLETLKDKYKYMLYDLKDEISLDLTYFFKLLSFAYKFIIKNKNLI